MNNASASIEAVPEASAQPDISVLTESEALVASVSGQGLGEPVIAIEVSLLEDLSGLGTPALVIDIGADAL